MHTKKVLKQLPTWKIAECLIFKYLTGKDENRDEYKLTVDGKEGSSTLKGFSYQKEVFEEIFNVRKAKTVYITLGYHKLSTLNPSSLGYTIIVIGVDSENNLMLGDDDVIWDAMIPGDFPKRTLAVDGTPTFINQNVSKTDVKKLVREYYDNWSVNTIRRKDRRDLGGTREIEKLKGHKVDVGDLPLLLEHKLSELKRIEFILGYHDEFEHKYKNRQGVQVAIPVEIGYSWIIVGNKDNASQPNEDHRMNSLFDYIFDYCDPCPKKCPDNLDQIS